MGWTVDGQVSGVGSAGWSNGALTPGTQYKYVLYLRDEQNTVVIEATVTVRTLTTVPLSTPTLTAVLTQSGAEWT